MTQGPPYRQPLCRWHWAAFVAACLLAALLRLGAPGVVEFKRDEASLSRLALDLASGARFPWLGIGSSVGFPNSPVSVYLFALPYILSNNPLIATLFVGFLNILAVSLLWKLTHRYFGPQPAAIAAIFYAASPWAAIFSRKIWAQDVLPPFIILTVFTGLLAFIEARPKCWAQLFHLPLLTLTIQLHFGAVTLLPLSLLMIALGWSRLRRPFWLGIGLAVLLCLPYLYGLHDAHLLRLSAVRDSLAKTTSDGSAPSHQFSLTALDYAWLTVAGTDIHALAGEHQFRAYLDTVPPAYPLFKLIPAGVVLAAVSMAVVACRRRSPLLLVFVAWLLLPVLAFTYTWATPQVHYAIPLLPAAFLIFGVGMASLGRSLFTRSYRLTAILAIVLAALVILQVWLFLSLLHFLNTHDTTGTFGTPLHNLLAVRTSILQEHPSRVIVASPGSSPAFDTEPAVWDVLLDDVPQVDFVPATNLWILPAEPALLLVTPAIGEQHPWLQAAIYPPQRTFSLRSGEGSYRLWLATPFAPSQNLLPTPAHFANGVALTGVWRASGALWIAWQVPQAQADTLYIVFVHVMAGESRIAQVDLPFWSERYWQAGDTVLFRADLQTDGADTLRIGLYTLLAANQYQVSPLLDTTGRYLDQWFTLPLTNLSRLPPSRRVTP